MNKINRKNFIRQSTFGLGGAWLLSQIPARLLADPAFRQLDIPIGFQTWTVRNMLAKDFEGTLKTMAGFGYKQLELCSPKGYADIGFGFLANTKPSDIKKTITDAGLFCQSCHFGFP